MLIQQGLAENALTPVAIAPLLEGLRPTLDGIAAEHDLVVDWRAMAENVPFVGHCTESILAHTAAQIEVAFRTVLHCSNQMPRQLVFLLNSSGDPRGPESLLYGWFRTRIQTGNFIASCELRPRLPVEAKSSDDDSLVLWIDDLTVELKPRQPYSSAFKSYLALDFPILSDAARYVLVSGANRKLPREVEWLRRDCEKIFYPPALPYEKADTRKTILFCLYWLDFGGAESFALEQMAAAKRAGYRVIITCDELRRHRLLDKARELAEAVYLIPHYGFRLSREDALLRILRWHKPDIIHIHHSFVMYRILPLVRMLQMPVRVIDTTHIVENRFGIFPKESVAHSEFIDLHHVVSHDLKSFYTDLAGIPERRIRVGKLHELSRNFQPSPGKWERVEPLRVLFIGRFVQQKRPYLFVEIANRLVRRFGADKFRFQSVGDGDLLASVRRQLQRSPARACFEFLPSGAPVANLLADAHVLVVCSDNEGLTLVGFEAAKADCLVVSTDVGGQRELVAPELLVPRQTFACISRTVEAIAGLLDGRLDRQALLERQRQRLKENLAEPSGTQVCLGFYGAEHAERPANPAAEGESRAPLTE